MMTEGQKSRVAELRSAIAASTPTTGAPREVRVAALVLKEELRRAGITARVLAKALGIHETTLCRWQQEGGSGRGLAMPAGRGRGARFREVHVTAADARPVRVATVAVTAPSSRGLRVAHAPSGLVIDGLDVETLAELLRRMS
jgi:hypothetical protein